MAFIERNALGNVSNSALPPFAPGPHSISAKIASRSFKPPRQSDGGRGDQSNKALGYEDININLRQSRLPNERLDQFRQNKMLVPGYKSSQQQKALAKLSGLNPQSAKRQHSSLVSPANNKNAANSRTNANLQGEPLTSNLKIGLQNSGATFTPGLGSHRDTALIYQKGQTSMARHELGRADQRSAVELPVAISPLTGTGKATKIGLRQAGAE